MDIYAVAVTLYEMLAGKLPFAARTYEELVVQVATTRPVPLHQVAPHVPLAIASSVDRGLARDREARWQTADQFAMALRGGLVGVTTPSSHAFEPTMHAPSSAPSAPRPSAQTPPPPVPTLGDPSTLRTAPPPVVSTASRNERRSSGAFVWIATVLAIVLAAGAGGALVVWRVMKAQTPATVAAVATQTPVPIAATAADTTPSATATQAAPTSPPSATATMAPTAGHATPHSVTGGAGVAFTFPADIVGSGDIVGIDNFLRTSVAPLAQRCRPARGSPPAIARVQAQYGDEAIHLAYPAHTNPGDKDAGKCVAGIMKSVANPTTWKPGKDNSGIMVVEVKLDPL